MVSSVRFRTAVAPKELFLRAIVCSKGGRGAARVLIGSGSLDDVEAFRVQRKIERLTDVVFVMDEAARLLQRTLEMRPEIARPYAVHATVQ
jgi:hypothetical protein